MVWAILLHMLLHMALSYTNTARSVFLFKGCSTHQSAYSQCIFCCFLSLYLASNLLCMPSQHLQLVLQVFPLHVLLGQSHSHDIWKTKSSWLKRSFLQQQASLSAGHLDPEHSACKPSSGQGPHSLIICSIPLNHPGIVGWSSEI